MIGTLWQHGETGRKAVEFNDEPKTVSQMTGWLPVGSVSLDHKPMEFSNTPWTDQAILMLRSDAFNVQGTVWNELRRIESVGPKLAEALRAIRELAKSDKASTVYIAALANAALREWDAP